MLTREQLLNGASFLPFEEVDVPELGGAVGVQGMTAGDAIAYHTELGDKGDPGVEALAKLVVKSVVDDKRQRIFADDEWQSLLAGDHAWPIAAINRIAIVAMRLNSGGTEGNLPAIPGVTSSSD